MKDFETHSPQEEFDDNFDVKQETEKVLEWTQKDVKQFAEQKIDIEEIEKISQLKINAIAIFAKHFEQNMTVYDKARLFWVNVEDVYDLEENAVRKWLIEYFGVNEEKKNYWIIKSWGFSFKDFFGFRKVLRFSNKEINWLDSSLVKLLIKFETWFEDENWNKVPWFRRLWVFKGKKEKNLKKITNYWSWNGSKENQKEVKENREQREKEQIIEIIEENKKSLKENVNEFNKWKKDSDKFIFDESKLNIKDLSLEDLKKIKEELEGIYSKFILHKEEYITFKENASKKNNANENLNNSDQEKEDIIDNNLDKNIENISEKRKMVIDLAIKKFKEKSIYFGINWRNKKAWHCTDRVDLVYKESIWESVYSVRWNDYFNSVRKITTWTKIWVWAKWYAKKQDFDKIKPWDHIMVDHLSKWKYWVWRTHSVIALEKPDSNWIVKVVSYPWPWYWPPRIEYYNLNWNWQKDWVLKKYYWQKNWYNLKNWKVLRINSLA